MAERIRLRDRRLHKEIFAQKFSRQDAKSAKKGNQSLGYLTRLLPFSPFFAALRLWREMLFI
jgi:hypothetical protein